MDPKMYKKSMKYMWNYIMVYCESKRYIADFWGFKTLRFQNWKRSGFKSLRFQNWKRSGSGSNKEYLIIAGNPVGNQGT
jgi:hypothetical protein